MTETRRIAAVQMTSGADVTENLRVAERWLGAAKEEGASVAALPENFAFMGVRDTDKLAVGEAPGRGPIQDFLAATARKLSLWIVAGTIPLEAPERRDRVYASSLVFDARGNVVARYDKMHLFDVDVPGGVAEKYRESATIAAGADRCVVAETPAGKTGLSVCYDLRFPELYRRLAAAGAEVLMIPSAFTERTGAAHWEPLLRARAIENQCYVVAPGQSGEHPGGRRTWGHTCIVDPWGRVLEQQGHGEGVVVADVPQETLAVLREQFPALKHRRL